MGTKPIDVGADMCPCDRYGPSSRDLSGVRTVLGIPRSTFGDAMVNRHSGFFEDLCDLILLNIRGRTKDRKIKRGIRKILPIDSTELRVHGSLFSTPGWRPTHSKGHQAMVKHHVVWNVDGEWIDDFIITGA